MRVSGGKRILGGTPHRRLKSAFRAVYHSVGNGAAPRIGLLCEYDALAGLGHGCGHHMQGPACLGAAVALKNRPLD